MNKDSKGLPIDFLGNLFDYFQQNKIRLNTVLLKQHLQTDLHKIFDNNINLGDSPNTTYRIVDEIIDTICSRVIHYFQQNINESKENVKLGKTKKHDPKQIFIKTVNNNISSYQSGRISKTFTNSTPEIDDTPKALFNYISLGYPIVHCVFNDEYLDDVDVGHKEIYFKETNIAFIDIDNDAEKGQRVWTIDELKEEELVKNYALLIYPSYSFEKDGNEKCRIVFKLERTITDSEEFKDLLAGLIDEFKSDPSTGSSTNIFYGNNRRDTSNNVDLHSVKQFDNYLPNSKIDEYINDGKNLRKNKSGGKKKQKQKPPIPATPSNIGATPSSTSTSPYVITTDEMNKYEVLLPDQDISGTIVSSVSSKVYANCPFPVSHMGPDNKQSTFMIGDTNTIKEQSVVLSCSGSNDKTTRWMVPTTYDSLSKNNLLSLTKKDVGDYGRDFKLESKHLNGGKILLVKAAQGLGKTNALEPIIDYYKHQGKSILFISHLRSLSFALATKFDLVNYLKPNDGILQPIVKDKKTKKAYDYLQNYNIDLTKPGLRFIVGPISILKSRKDGAKLRQYKWDLIVCDEWEQLLLQCLGGQLINDKTRIHFTKNFLYIFKNLFMKAGKTILLDADIGNLTLSFLQYSNLKNVYLYWNTFKPPTRDVFFVYRKNHLYSYLHTFLKDNKKIIYVCNQRVEALRIQENIKHHFHNLNILCITKDTINSKAVRNLIAKPREILPQIDVLIFNSAMSTGVSLITDKEHHFDYVFGTFANRLQFKPGIKDEQFTTSPLTNFQMIQRYRRSIPIYLYVDHISVHNLEDNLKDNYLEEIRDDNTTMEYFHYNFNLEYLDFNNRYNKLYYASMVAYCHEKGFNTKLLYATQQELDDGEKAFSKNLLQVIHRRRQLTFEDIKSKDIPAEENEKLKLIKTLFDNLQFDWDIIDFKYGYILNHGDVIQRFRERCMDRKPDILTHFNINVPTTLYPKSNKETFDNKLLYTFLKELFKVALNLDLMIYSPWLESQDAKKYTSKFQQKDVEVYGLYNLPDDFDLEEYLKAVAEIELWMEIYEDLKN